MLAWPAPPHSLTAPPLTPLPPLQEVVEHLISVGLLSSWDVRSKGGYNGLWGATLHEVNDRMAQFGGRLSLDELDVDAVERWIVQVGWRTDSLPLMLAHRGPEQAISRPKRVHPLLFCMTAEKEPDAEPSVSAARPRLAHRLHPG